MAFLTRSRILFVALSLCLSIGAMAEDHKAAADQVATRSAAPVKSAAATKSETPSVTEKAAEEKSGTGQTSAGKAAAAAKPEAPPASGKAPETAVDLKRTITNGMAGSLKASESRSERATPERIVERPAARISAATRRVALAAVAVRPGETNPAEKPSVEVHATHAPHWSYEGETGPQAWATLAPEFASCGTGQRQSPIDIRDGLKVDLEPIAFEYRPSSFKVNDDGHAIQANVNGWNSMRLMGRVFRLVQFHFHRPSEEMIDGKQFEMVVHMVHQDAQGRLAVVAVLVEVGARQPVIQTILNNLPLEKNSEVAVNSSSLDMNQMLPGDRRYFTYMGSLTTPPCTEDVLWIVMKQPVQATAEQLNLFSRIYPMNARPIQASAGRMIKESN
jgi:carbonic anhydrase